MQISTRAWLRATTLLAGCLVAFPAIAGTISGTVTDTTGADALTGAQVHLIELGRTATTDDAGSFRFADVPAGQYTLETTYVGGQTSRREIKVGEHGTVKVSIGIEAQGGIEHVLVIGQRAMMASSLSRQRSSDTVESVLTRDAIGQFPDQNVAESTRRLSGVNVLNDQGEGRFVAVRGLSPDLNASSVNGARLPAPESDIRAVALDVIPSELVESIEIKKTLTPDMDADTIGASIEIKTTRGFDRKKPFLSLTAEGSYNDLNGAVSPKFGADFAYPITSDFGIAGGVSFQRRVTSTMNTEMEDWNTSGGVDYAGTVEYRDYDVVRKRVGSSLSLDWRVNGNTNLYARGIYSIFDDTEQRRRLVFKLEEPSFGTATTATFLSGDDRIRVRRDLKDRFEGQKIQNYQLGGETFLGPWSFEYNASYSEAQEHEYKTQDPTRFQQDFKKAGQLQVTFDYSDLKLTTYNIDGGSKVADFYDPSKYEFDDLEQVDGMSRDEEWAYKFDVARDFALEDGTLQIKAGGKARLRNKSYGLTLQLYDGFAGSYTLADVTGSQTYDLLNINPVPGRGQVRAFNTAHAGDFELSTVDTDYESNVSDYQVKENIYAGYLMGRYERGPLLAIAGVRVEHTEDDVYGNLVELVEDGGTHGGVPVVGDTVFVTPDGFKKSYTDWLPSAALRWNAGDDLILRAGVSRSIVRPKPGDMAPRFAVNENDSGDREGEFGNPDLDPYRAWNFDLDTAWYFSNDGVLQIGAFYKKVKDFIVTANFKDTDAPYYGVFNGVSFNEASIPLNGDNATVQGIEFNYQQALTMLPGALDGLLVGFNYTYTDAEGKVNGRTIPLPASAKNTFNAMLGYEKGPVSLRFSAAYRDLYLDELGGSAETDRYVKGHIQLDLVAKYKINDNLRVYAEFVNLNNEPYLAYQRGPSRDRLLQYESYSWTGKFGIRATF